LAKACAEPPLPQELAFALALAEEKPPMKGCTNVGWGAKQGLTPPWGTNVGTKALNCSGLGACAV
jgi:hypothetical protein